MNRETAIAAARAGAFAAFISGGLSTFFIVIAVMSSAQDGLLGVMNDPANFLDVLLLVGLGIGVMRRFSRWCAVVLCVYWIWASVQVVISGLDEGGASLAGLPLRLLFLYFFGRAVVGTFAWHRIEKTENPNYRPPSKWLAWVGTPVVLLFLGLATFGIFLEEGLAPPPEVMLGEEVSTEMRNQLITEEIILPEEEIEFFYSLGITTILTDGTLMTDRRIIVLATGEEEELEIYEMFYPEIAGIRLLEAGDALNDSLYQVTGHDPDTWMQFYLSRGQNRDKAFARSLRLKLTALAQSEGTP